MMACRKLLSISLLSATALLTANFSYAKPINWNVLSTIQQDVLQGHGSKWSSYSEEYQRQLLSSIQQEVQRKVAYKNWVKTKLPAHVRESLFRNKIAMSESEFKQYVDRLMLKYGRPQ